MGELRSRGVGQTGALYGFFTGTFRAMDEYGPTHTVVCWDDWKNGPAERKKLSSAYKDRRTADQSPEREEVFKAVNTQLHLLIEFLQYLGVKQARSPGWEADDVMGTLARRYGEEPDSHVSIFTGDKDLLQCITSNVQVLRPTFNGGLEVVTKKSFKKTYGFGVKDFVLYKSLVGDPSDGYPGVPGIGDKMAKTLISEFVLNRQLGGLEPILETAENDEAIWEGHPALKPRMGQLLRTGADSARLSYKLATINTAAPLKWVKRDQNFRAVKDLLEDWEMSTVLSRFKHLKKLAWGGKLRLK